MTVLRLQPYIATDRKLWKSRGKPFITVLAFCFPFNKRVLKMQIDKLSSFNKRFFKKILGLQIQCKRHELDYTHEHVADLLGLSPKAVKMIENGQKSITQDLFETLIDVFRLEPNELLEMSRITHVQYLMSLYKEIDENFPA